MTDITELAQREKFEAWVMTQICISKSTLEGLRTSDGYRNSTLSGRDYNLMWNLWKAAGAELVEALEKAQSRDVIQSAKDYHFDQQADRIAELDAELEREREKSRRVMSRIAELESRTVTAPQNDYFASLVALARVSADKAMKKFPQPNYVLLKVAEEAGEVVQAGVHYAENRMEWKQVEGEIVQLLAMLIRLVTEGDQINGVTPPASCAAGIKVEAE